MCFTIVVALAVAIPAVYVFLVGKAAHSSVQELRADETSRSRYFDALKTLVAAGGVAVAIVVAGLQQKVAGPPGILRSAALLLTSSVVLSVWTLLEMSRVYERARGRALNLRDMWSVLVLGYLALATFLLGFAFLGRLAASI